MPQFVFLYIVPKVAKDKLLEFAGKGADKIIFIATVVNILAT